MQLPVRLLSPRRREGIYLTVDLAAFAFTIDFEDLTKLKNWVTESAKATDIVMEELRFPREDVNRTAIIHALEGFFGRLDDLTFTAYEAALDGLDYDAAFRDWHTAVAHEEALHISEILDARSRETADAVLAEVLKARGYTVHEMAALLSSVTQE